MKIIDDFLDVGSIINIEKTFFNRNVLWKFDKSTLKPGTFCTNKNSIDCHQFVHSVFIENQIVSNPGEYNLCLSILNELIDFKIKINRIKVNLNTNLTNYKKENHQPIHIDDTSENMNSLIYYINDSDGDTLFFDEKENVINRVSPKKGRAVLFNSNIKHAACNPIIYDCRMIINFVFGENNE